MLFSLKLSTCHVTQCLQVQAVELIKVMAAKLCFLKGQNMTSTNCNWAEDQHIKRRSYTNAKLHLVQDGIVAG